MMMLRTRGGPMGARGTRASSTIETFPGAVVARNPQLVGALHVEVKVLAVGLDALVEVCEAQLGDALDVGLPARAVVAGARRTTPL